jgi:hypothetical protein
MSKGPMLLFLGFVCLILAAGVVLARSSIRPAEETKRGQEFQHLLGGLGFGPARDLRRCAFAFDPRLSSSCSQDWEPIPCGTDFCPYHACSILDYPSWQPSLE